MDSFSLTKRNTIQLITRQAIEKGWFTGAVIRLEREGGLLYEEAFGWAQVTPQLKIPMRPTTLFDIASLTKLFTTTLLLRFVSEGRVSLDVPLSELGGGKIKEMLRENGTFGTFFTTRTLRCLLTHRSGLPYWYPFYTVRKGKTHLLNKDPRAREELYRLWSSIVREVMDRYPPQSKTVYSDLNFMLGGFIIEWVGGLPLEEAFARWVRDPLGLEDTGYAIAGQSSALPLSRFAATEFGNRIEMGMVKDLGLEFSGWRPLDTPIIREPNDGNCHYFFDDVAGHAGIFSTAKDLCRLGGLFAGAYAPPLDLPTTSSYPVDTGPLIECNLLQEAVRDQGNGRGLGFQFDSRYPEGCGHTGFTGTCLYVNRKKKLVLCILTNRLHVPTPCDIDPYRTAVVETLLLDIR